MHCLLIHQVFVGPDEAGGTRHYDLARMIAESGHDFTVVTSTVSYLTGEPRARTPFLGPASRPEAVRVLSGWTPRTLHRSFAWRVVAFLVFMVTSIQKGLFAHRVDLVMGTSPPIFQAVSAWIVAALRRRPFLLEIRDLWPDFAIDMGVLRNPILIRVSKWLERFLYCRADHFIVNSPAYREYLLGKGIPDLMISVVPNGVDVAVFDPAARGGAFRAELGLDERDFLVTYAGALGMANDIPTILRAATRLRGLAPDIRILVVGDGKERTSIEEAVAREGLTNVSVLGAVPKKKVPEVLAASDACLATLMDIPMFRTTYPNKVFDYMAAGRPVVLAIDGVIREVVETAQAGVFVQPGDDQALASVLSTLATNRLAASRMGVQGRLYVVEHFDRRKQSVAFAEVLLKVASGRVGRATD